MRMLDILFHLTDTYQVCPPSRAWPWLRSTPQILRRAAVWSRITELDISYLISKVLLHYCTLRVITTPHIRSDKTDQRGLSDNFNYQSLTFVEYKVCDFLLFKKQAFFS